MIFKLNKELYPKQSIIKAIKAYKEIADFEVSQEGSYYLVVSQIDSAEEELIRDEFLNFVLSCINQ